MRLDKYLTAAGCGSRSEVKKLIRSGLITVNGERVNKPEMQINADSDCIKNAGSEVCFSEFVYYMLNKPSGVVSATEDKTCGTVLDILLNSGDGRPYAKGVFPVGRLDKDTEGLLLLTNDGNLAHRLLAPGRHVDKTYYARVDGSINDSDIQAFHEGIDIGEAKPLLPAMLEVISESREMSEVRITIHEGKFHQIKRMFRHRNRSVIYLKRLAMGSLVLDESLGPGEWRELTADEIDKLYRENLL